MASLELLAPLLQAHAHGPRAAQAPASAMDLACGAGRNALFLARLGYEVTAVDVADEALRLLAAEAGRSGLEVRTLQADLDIYRPLPDSYDLVVQAYFLDRRLWPHLAAALRPGGMLFVETFTEDRPFEAGRPVRRAHLLDRGELAGAFPDLQAVYYSEQAASGIATLLARRAEGPQGTRGEGRRISFAEHRQHASATEEGAGREGTGSVRRWPT